MALLQRTGKRKALMRAGRSFPSSSEMLIVSVPVENMSQSPAPLRIIGADVCESIAPRMEALAPARKLLLVSDENTWAAAGEMVHAKLAASHEVTELRLERGIRATQDLALNIADKASGQEMILAVGSGTINDVCKLAAHARHLPYAVVATAASMNGYTSANASLEIDGIKDSLPAQAPIAVFADIGVLTKAPVRLTRAGVGDTLCRTVVEADMLMSHLLLGTPYPAELFARLKRHETTLITGTFNTEQGQTPQFMTTLIEALLDSGDAMREFGSSAVASQGEHMIAHTLESRYGQEMHNLFHGELIAVASITSSLMQHRMMLSAPTVKSMPYELRQFETLFGKFHGQLLMERYQKKLLSAEQAIEINQKLVSGWPAIREALTAVMIPTKTLERAYIHSGLGTQPSQIGIADERYRYAASYAHLTRDRFTFLDLAAMNGKRIG